VIGETQAMVLEALENSEGGNFAGGVHDKVYKETGGRVFIGADNIYQVFLRLSRRGLIEKTESPKEKGRVKHTGWGALGISRIYYKATDAGRAELEEHKRKARES
jgi:DNA-binding PadR family transcriptional regulator